jgi:hypothetical protein
MHELLKPGSDVHSRVPACADLVVLRRASQKIFGIPGYETYKEYVMALPLDGKAIFRGTLKEKRARLNACLSVEASAPDLANGKGTIYAFDSVPGMAHFRNTVLPSMLGDPTLANLECELNAYKVNRSNKPTKMKDHKGIGYHMDGERTIVVCQRLGTTPNSLAFHFFSRFGPVGKRFLQTLHDGDMYFFSEFLVTGGGGWGSACHLRHAAGDAKYVLTTAQLLAKREKQLAKGRERKQLRQLAKATRKRKAPAGDHLEAAAKF